MTGAKKLGIFGGSFDPVHNGHISLAKNAMKEFGLDTVFFVPARTPPHKIGKSLTGAAKRMEMLRLAVHNMKGFKLSLHEIKRTTPTYTVETLGYFKKRFPKHELFFLMGSDSLNELGAWKQPGKILKTCTIISAKRKGSSVKSAYTRDVLFLKSAIPGVSSTEIRGLVKNKKSIKGLVPEKVRAYILNNHIYEN